MYLFKGISLAKIWMNSFNVGHLSFSQGASDRRLDRPGLILALLPLAPCSPGLSDETLKML